MRYHKGYHCPRSEKTVNEISKTNKDFEKYFKYSIYNTQNYGISKKNKNLFNKYLNLKNLSLIPGEKYFSSNIEGSIKSEEKILNYFTAKKKF